MSAEKNPVWQGLMDEAYARWQEGGDLHGKSSRDFIAALPPLHRYAVMLGNLNYQVHNGGFNQWVDNGYAVVAEDLIEVLKLIGTRNAIKTISLINVLIPHIDFSETRDGFGRSRWIEMNVTKYEWQECYKCHGTGFIENTEEVSECSYCHGTGGDDGEYEDNVEMGPEVAEKLDDVYYGYSDEFESEVEEFLKQGVVVC